MNNKDWTWESSPKRQFNIRKIQRCYDMEYNIPIEPIEVPEGPVNPLRGILERFFGGL